jgi:hypothetical protein
LGLRGVLASIRLTASVLQGSEETLRLKTAAVTAILGAIALVAVLAPGASAAFPQFQITHFGADNDPDTGAQLAAISFNSRADRYLVVYLGGSRATNTDEDFWNVYGQIVDVNGNPIGGQFQINQTTTNELGDFEPPSVAYDPQTNQWMVVWDEGTPTTTDDAIYSQLVDVNGGLVGPLSQRISINGYDDIETVPVVYNPTSSWWCGPPWGRPPANRICGRSG